MRNRWGILAVLFAARATMAFQFQSVAAVAPLLSSEFGVGLADIGLLIGLYFAPGVALALPGGAIGQRFGDKRTVLGALLLMLAGGVLMASSTSWNMQIAGRLIAGAGGVILSVQLTKMVTDWFAGKEIATAMAIFVNSWPARHRGLPADAAGGRHRYGVGAAHLGRRRASSPAASCCSRAVPAAGRTRGYVDGGSAASGPQRRARRDRGRPDLGSVQCRLCEVFSFGPSMLVEHGWSVAAAGSTISIVLWVAAFPFRSAASSPIAAGGPQPFWSRAAIVFAALMVPLPRSGAVIPIVVALGLISGQPAGPIMSLPARVLQPQTRAIGMGLFFTMFYACMMLGPVVGGACAKWAGSAAAAFDFGAAMILLCPVLLWAFYRIPHGRRK